MGDCQHPRGQVYDDHTGLNGGRCGACGDVWDDATSSWCPADESGVPQLTLADVRHFVVNEVEHVQVDVFGNEAGRKVRVTNKRNGAVREFDVPPEAVEPAPIMLPLALNRLLGLHPPNGGGTNTDGTPYFCDTCEMAGPSREPYEQIRNDTTEAHYPCKLLNKDVWGENPQCDWADWQRAAQVELERMLRLRITNSPS